ncbi:hypothetical protein ACMBCM_06635 [Spiroplasma sp. K1]
MLGDGCWNLGNIRWRLLELSLSLSLSLSLFLRNKFLNTFVMPNFLVFKTIFMFSKTNFLVF